MTMTNMQLTPEEAKQDVACCSPDPGAGPKYPYGLRIDLEGETVKKLNLPQIPGVGQRMRLTALVDVNSVRQYESQQDKEISITLQITDMELAEERETSPEQVLFGG